MDSSITDNGPSEMSKLIVISRNNDGLLKNEEQIKSLKAADLDIDHTFGEVGHGLILYK